MIRRVEVTVNGSESNDTDSDFITEATLVERLRSWATTHEGLTIPAGMMLEAADALDAKDREMAHHAEWVGKLIGQRNGLRSALLALVEAIERQYPAQSSHVRQQVQFAKDTLRDE
jgi:hypothetical protein